MAEGERGTKLTIQIPEGVDVDIESVPTGDPPQFDSGAAPVNETDPPTGYGKGYRWNAAGCSKVKPKK